MNFRTTYVMMGIVAVLLGVLSYYAFFGGDKKLSADGLLLESLNKGGCKPSDITQLEIERAGTRFVFVRQSAGRWKMTSPIQDRADSLLVDRIIAELLTAKRQEKGAELTTNLGIHGLDKPTVKITLKRGDRTGTLSLGNVTIGGDTARVYVLSSDRPDKPQATLRSSLMSLFKPKAPSGENTAEMTVGLDEFRLKSLLGERLQDPASEVTGIHVTFDKQELLLTKNPATRNWDFEIPAGYGTAELNPPASPPANPEQINSIRQLVNNIVEIKVPGPDAFIDDAGEYATYGLDPTSEKVMRIDLTRNDGLTETLFVGNEVKDLPPSDKVYVRYEGSASVAKVNWAFPRAIQTLMKDLNRLRDKTFLPMTVGKVDALDLDVRGSKFSLRKTSETPVIWQVFGPEDTGFTASNLAVETLLRELGKRDNIQAFPDPAAKNPSAGFDKPEIEIKIWEKGIVPGEKDAGTSKPKVSDTPTYRVLFGKADIATVFARRYSGELLLDAYLPLPLLSLAGKPRVEYIEPSILPFSPERVTKITFNRGTEKWEMTHDDKAIPAAAWKIVSPAAKAGRLADAKKIDLILRDLGTLRPTKVVTDKPTPDQLKTLALDPASARVTIQIKLETEERSYLLGNDVGTEKQSIYAKTGDSPMVFEVARSIFLASQEGDLQDLVVYRVDPTKLKSFKLTGWQDILGEQAIREFEIKNGIWILKSDPTKPLDQTKILDFLSYIYAPRAEALLMGPIKPEQKLDPKLGAMEIVLDQGDSKPVTLIVGATDGVFVFATSNQAPGEVFTLLKDRFRAVREKPAVFNKD